MPHAHRQVPNRNARPSFLLRETYREDGKVKNRTLANLSKLPIERIERRPRQRCSAGRSAAGRRTGRRVDSASLCLLSYIIGLHQNEDKVQSRLWT